MNKTSKRGFLSGLAVQGVAVSLMAILFVPGNTAGMTPKPTDEKNDSTVKKWKKDEHTLKRLTSSLNGTDSVNISGRKLLPLLSVQQLVKGAAAVYVQEPSGEPGTKQSMLLRGTSVPLVDRLSYMDAQPTVYLNGIPVADDRRYTYSIRQNNITAPGTMSNILAGVDMNNIERFEVITDPARLAKLGPDAANGALWITTKDGFYGGPHFSVDASLSFAPKPGSVRMTSAADELDFRRHFYTGDEYLNHLPAWLDINKSPELFGPTNWADDYYNNGLGYSINTSIGNSERLANYLFTFGTTRGAGVTDNTYYNKYNIGLNLNMVPFHGLTVNLAAHATKSERDRNRNMLDRLSETEYLPDLSTPFVPTLENMALYKELSYDEDDSNDNMLINGVLRLNYVWRDLHAHADVDFNYTTNTRHVFWPTPMLGNMSYVSDYSGYNRRFYGTAGLGYKLSYGLHHADISWDGTLREDKYHYVYDRGYNGEDDKKQSTSGGGFFQFRYLDSEAIHIASSVFNINYDYNSLIGLNIVLRHDGTSAMGSYARWLFTPGVSADWNIKKTLLTGSKTVDKLNLRLSYARVGKFLSSDTYGLGPQYVSGGISWNSAMLVGSYNSFATISRPYSSGWVGYYTNWPVSDKLEVSVTGSAFCKRLSWSLSAYVNKDKNLLTQVPAERESGYRYTFKQGMAVENKGFEVTLSGSPIVHKDLKWTLNATLSHNINTLKALPGGLDEMIIGDRLLRVGEAVDRFYLLSNEGIDENNNPVWGEKRLTGHILPSVYGGFGTVVKYKQFDLSVDFNYSLGQSAMNYRAYRKYNFSRLEQSNTLDAVNETFFWRSDNLPTDYPYYDVESGKDPYRFDQDLYLESTSYLKLRSVSLGYLFKMKKKSFYVYGSATNIFTVSGFSGDDPELVDFDGVYRGYGTPLPRTYTLGVKITF